MPNTSNKESKGSGKNGQSGRPAWLVPVLVAAAILVVVLAIVLVVGFVILPRISDGETRENVTVAETVSDVNGTGEEGESETGEGEEPDLINDGENAEDEDAGDSDSASEEGEGLGDLVPKEGEGFGDPDAEDGESAGDPDAEEPEDGGAATVRDDAEVYTFTDGDGNVIEMKACDYFLGNDLIREDNGSTWSFSYDPEEGKGSVEITEGETAIGTYEIYYYLTVESGETVCELISADDPSVSYVYYVEKVRVASGGIGYLGGQFRNTMSGYSFMLYTPRAYEENVGDREDIVYGNAGTSRTWSYNTATSTLTIYGIGEIADYTKETLGERPWEAYSSQARSIEIREGITGIGSYAFYGFEQLETMSVPGSVLEIGAYAFAYTGTTGAGALCADLSEGVTQIGDSAFLYSGLTQIALPVSLTQIGDYAFCYCTELTALEIPAGVEMIGTAVLRGCENLAVLTVDEGNESFTAEDNVLFNQDETLLIAYAAACEAESYTIPDTVTEIAASAFERCVNLTEVVIPGSVTQVGFYVFRSSRSLESVTLERGVERIGFGMFEDCTALTQVRMALTVTQIGNDAFSGCESLTDVYYAGASTVWNEIDMGSGNEALQEAEIHYSSLF